MLLILFIIYFPQFSYPASHLGGWALLESYLAKTHRSLGRRFFLFNFFVRGRKSMIDEREGLRSPHVQNLHSASRARWMRGGRWPSHACIQLSFKWIISVVVFWRDSSVYIENMRILWICWYPDYCQDKVILITQDWPGTLGSMRAPWFWRPVSWIRYYLALELPPIIVFLKNLFFLPRSFCVVLRWGFLFLVSFVGHLLL